ncbi:hypothetical protein [Escherichia coli]|uniref:hypothetical protein n=1 Tax=Escherichia coli TaxID=562 RepID=UPI003D24ABC3
MDNPQETLPIFDNSLYTIVVSLLLKKCKQQGKTLTSDQGAAYKLVIDWLLYFIIEKINLKN